MDTKVPNALTIAEQLCNGASEKNPETEIIVVEAVTSLVNALGKGNQEAINTALQKLGINQDTALLNHVGHLARSLHNALMSFKANLNRSNETMHNTTIPDAAVKLESVITMTQQAAEKTMNLIDEQVESVKECRSRLSTAKEVFKNTKSTKNDLQNAFQMLVESQEAKLQSIEEASSQILMTQEYQDLSGQALKKVVKLVTHIEGELISLVKLFGIQEDTHHDTKSSEETKLDQDEADAILSSFGF